MSSDLITFLRARLDEDEQIDRKYVRHGHLLLADIEAKRQIIDVHQNEDDTCRVCCREAYMEEIWDGVHEHVEWRRNNEPWPCDTLRLLALPYADHPDYQEEWRP